MMALLSHRRVAVIALAAVAALGLTACTPTDAPTPGGESAGSGDAQTVAEACALIDETIAGATSEFEDAASGEPAAVVDAMKTAAENIAAASSQVSNSEVAALIPSLEEMFEKTAEIMQAVVDGDTAKLGDLAEVGQGFQETTQRFQELCAR